MMGIMHLVQQLYSDRQVNDISALLRYHEIDRPYVRHWIAELGLDTFGIITI
jgi:hypothetical protein